MIIEISKVVNGERKIVEIIPTRHSKVTKRSSKEKNVIKISTETMIAILFPDMQEGLYNALREFGAVTNYQLHGFTADVRLVNSHFINGDMSVIFNATIHRENFDTYETFMIHWTDFENFYLAHRK